MTKYREIFLLKSLGFSDRNIAHTVMACPEILLLKSQKKLLK